MYNNKLKAIVLPVVIALAIVLGMGINSLLDHKEVPVNMGQRMIGSKLDYILNMINYSYVDSVDIHKIEEDAIPQILNDLDPHTVYIPAKDMQRVNEEMVGNFGGIGVQFYKYLDTVTVVKVVPGGPSEAAGLQDGDRIVKVNDSIVAGRNTEFLENMELKDIPDSCFYPAQADKIRYVASFDEFVQEVKVGDEAPAYELTDVMTGKVYSNASLQGKIVVMQFTSTGCVGCVLAQPWMNKLYDRWKEQPELVFLCAGLLSEKDAKIQVEKYEFAYPMTTCNQAFFWSFGVQAIPSYYVIGKDNQVLARPQSHIGLKNFLDSYFNK